LIRTIAFCAAAFMFPGESQGAMSIQTPCTKVCTIDPVSRLCVGCGRTLDEIAQWSALTAGERARVMAELPRRMARVTAAKAVAADHVRGVP
jgi:predicted Fe-S protein YdhL (DUF1289 family)